MSCWFVDVPKIKEKMLAANEQINWIPDHIKHGRFGNWLEGAREWAISRNRFWGNPLPIWKCDGSDYIEVIGSCAELEEKSGQKVTDLHKEFVDKLTWPSPDGKGTMRRIPDVLDCWFESGSMPYAQLHYPFENKEKFEKNFPADFINEGLDQTRGWFYSLTVIAAALFDSPAFLNCIVSGIVLAKDGKKMSKSLGNYTDPMEIVAQYGADALRFYLMNCSVVRADDLKFDDEGVKDVLKILNIPLWNAYSFFVTYANIDNYTPSETPFDKLEKPLDRWIISDLNLLVEKVTKAMDAYDLQSACQALLSFIDDLNNWYIRRSRRRFWRSENDKDKKQAYDTLYKVLITFVKVAAPIIPFITEEIYQNLRTEDMKESVHLCDFPEVNDKERDPALEEEMRLVMKAVSMGHSLRVASNLKVRQPLEKFFIVDRNPAHRDILSRNEDILKEELNVKKVVIEENEDDLVTYSAKANFKVLGAKLGKSMKDVASKIQAFTSEKVGSLLDGASAIVESIQDKFEITKDDIIVNRTEKANVKAYNEGELTVGYDTEITPELMAEGIARDVVRAVQTARKNAGLEVSDHIKLTISSTESVNAAIKSFHDYISKETLTDEIIIAENDGEACAIGDDEGKIRVERA